MSSVFHINVFQTLLINVNSSHWNMLKRDSYWEAFWQQLEPLGSQGVPSQSSTLERECQGLVLVFRKGPDARPLQGFPTVLSLNDPCSGHGRLYMRKQNHQKTQRRGKENINLEPSWQIRKDATSPQKSPRSRRHVARDTPPERSAKRTGRVLIPKLGTPYHIC